LLSEPVRLRVLLADPDRSFCAAVEAVLARSERVQVVGCAHDGVQALALARSHTPDLVLLGVELGARDQSSVEGLRRLRPGTAVVLLADGGNEALGEAMRTTGASAVMKKDAHLSENLELVAALASLSTVRATENEPPL
jgi:two-component system, NarL family, response regulator DesR